MMLFYSSERLHLKFREIERPEKKVLRWLPEIARAGEAIGSQDIIIEPAVINIAFDRLLLQDLLTLSRNTEKPQLVRCITAAQTKQIENSPSFPFQIVGYNLTDLSLQQLAKTHNENVRAPARFAILNRYSTAFGDSIILLTALAEFRKRVEQAIGAVSIDILHHALNLEAELLYRDSAVIDNVIRLPIPLSDLTRYDAYVDLSEEILLSSIPRVDEMLQRLGLDPTSVPDHRKRCGRALNIDRWPVRQRIRSLRSAGKKMLLFHHRASNQFRSIPPGALKRVLDQIGESGQWQVVTALGLNEADSFLLDLSEECKTFDDLASIIKSVDAVLTVDTCTYHLADAFDIPAAVMFVSMNPDLRIGYYPNAFGLLIGGEQRSILGLHSASEIKHQRIADDAWINVDIRHLLVQLEHAVFGQRPTPILATESSRS